MPRDIRDILKEDSNKTLELSSNHKDRFEKKLQQLHKSKTNNYWFLKIAASIVLLVSLGYFFFPKEGNTIPTLPTDEAKIVNLGSISPEMQQIESYYLTAINYEMASIEPSPENKVILDKYLEKIAQLTEEYKQLSIELSEKGIDEETINALITNLQLRLQLLLELKDTIKEIKTPKNIDNEKTTV